MIESNRIVLVDKEDIQLDLEYNKDFAVLHLPRLKLTKGTLADFECTVEDIWKFMCTVGYENIWTAIPPSDKTMAKLLSRIGAEKQGHAQGLDVYEYKGGN